MCSGHIGASLKEISKESAAVHRLPSASETLTDDGQRALLQVNSLTEPAEDNEEDLDSMVAIDKKR